MLALLIVGGGAFFVLARFRMRHDVLYKKGVLHLESGNYQAAIGSFRSALELKPDYGVAQMGVVRALVHGREFDEAEVELDKAVQMGVEEAEAALLRARLLSLRASYRIQTAGSAVDVELCDSVIEQDVQPAILLVEEHAGDADSPALAYTALGDLYMQKSAVLTVKWRLLGAARDLARRLDREEEAAAKHAQALAVTPEMGEAQRSAMAAYGRAVEVDPELARPRLAIARQVLASYIPRPDVAKSVLGPIIEREPGHRGARELLAVAERLVGNHDGALDHIRVVRQDRQDDVGLLQAETQILVDAERWEEADALSLKLIELGPNSIAAAYLRGKVLLEEGRSGEALNHLQNIFARITQPWPQARLALAQALHKQGNRQQAMSAFRQALEDVSATLVTNIRMAGELRTVQYESCMALAGELNEESPESAAEYATRALAIFPHRPEAFDAVKQARMAAGSPLGELEGIVLLHAAGLLATGDLDGTLAVCEEAIEELRTSEWGSQLRLLRARLLSRRGSYREAAEAYGELRETFPDKRPAYELAALHTRLGHFDDARTVYEELLQSDQSDVRAIAGLAGALARSGDMESARAVLSRADRELGSVAVRALLMDLYLREGQIEEAVMLARSHVDSVPDSGAAHAVLAELLWRSGDLADARREFDEALKLGPEFLQAYRRGLLDLHEGRTAQAVSLFEDARDRFPDGLSPKVHLAVALQADGRLQDAAELMQQTLQEARAERAVMDMLRGYLAVMYAALGDIEAATLHNNQARMSELGLRQDRQDLLNFLGAADEPRRQEVGTALNLLVAFSRARCFQPTLERVEALEEMLPGRPLPSCWRASVLDQQARHDEAVEQYEKIIREHPDLIFARMRLADSHARHGEAESAVRVLEEALPYVSEEQAAVIHLSLGQFYEGQNRLESAISSYEAAMRHRAVAALACNNLAYILATRKNDLTAALPLAEQALELGGPIPQVLDTLGWIHCLVGNLEEAAKYLEAAKRGLSAVPTIRYHLGVAYLRAGRRGEARTELEEALAISRTFPEAEEAVKLLGDL